MTECAIVIADVAGSTPLYEAEGDDKAMDLVVGCLDSISDVHWRHGGDFIVSRGDDVHFTFAEPAAAFAAADEVLNSPACTRLPLHYAIHWGEALQGPGNIFGDAVNLAARMAAMSNPGEALMSLEFVEHLPPQTRSRLRPLQSFTVKGRSQPVDIFALFAGVATEAATMLPAHLGGTPVASVVALHLTAPDGPVALSEGEAVTIGRDPACEIVQALQWVSRRHAVLRVRGGLVELTDQSSNGTYLTLDGRDEVLIRRQSVVLAGSGVISAGLPRGDKGAAAMAFRVASGAG